jgi:hypothetical protein
MSERVDELRAEVAKDHAVLDRHERARSAAVKAWRTRRDIAAGKRPPTRQARARVLAVDGPFAGKTLLLERELVARDAWEIPGATYRFADSDGGRLAYLANTDPQLPFIGWRGWGFAHRRGHGIPLAYDIPKLASGVSDVVWPGGAPLAAECNQIRRVHVAGSEQETEIAAHVGEPAPQTDCSCGIYCTLTQRALHEAGHWYDDVVGLLAGWGRVVEHESGFRFARAYPVLLVVTADRDAIASRRLFVGPLRREYGVPVAMAAPERVLDVVSEYVASATSALPEWVYRALPPDLRAAGLEHDRKTRKETANG